MAVLRSSVKSLFFSALVLGASLLFTSSAFATPLPILPDPALQTCLDEQVAANGWTTAEEVTTFYCIDRGVEYVGGLEQLMNLVELDLSENRIDDIYNLLFQYTGLTTLRLSGNAGIPYYQAQQLIEQNVNLVRIGLDDISINAPLPVFINQTSLQPYALVELGLANTGLTDSYGLPQYPLLETLDLANNQLGYMASLSSLVFLTELDISYNVLDNGIVNELNGLVGLDTLNLSGNTLINLSQLVPVIQNNPGLTHVGLNGIVVDTPLDVFHDPSSGQPYALIELDLGNTGLQNIYGIEQYGTLEKLVLSDNSIRDILPLSGLSLHELDIANNIVSDVSPLNAMVNLSRLNLSGNRGIDRTDAFYLISNNPGLAHIGLNGINIGPDFFDFQVAYTGAPEQLLTLDLGNTGIVGGIDVGPYTSLRSLNLANLEHVNLWSLSALPLRELDLSYMNLNNIYDLVNLHQLEYLNLSGIPGINLNDLYWVLQENHDLAHLLLNDIELINGVGALFNSLEWNGQPYRLTELSLNNTGIDHVNGIGNFQQLRKVSLGNNRLFSAHELNYLVLDELDLSYNDLDYMPDLSSHQFLKKLNLSGNPRIDFNQILPVLANNYMLTHIGLNGIDVNNSFPYLSSSVSGQPYRLKKLDLGNAGASDLASNHIHFYTSLENLNLSNNGISDIQGLSGLQLQELDLSGNRIVDINPLMTNDHLRALNVSGNASIDFNQLYLLIDTNIDLMDIGLNGIAINGPLPLFSNPASGRPYNLRALDLGNTGLQNIVGIEQYDDLESLNLAGNGLDNIAPLSMMPLRQLDVSDNNIVDVTPLGSGTMYNRLQKLNLSGNPVTDIYQLMDVLNYHFELTHLGVNGIAVNSDIFFLYSPVTGRAYAFVELDLGNTNIGDVYNISNYPTLQALNLANNDLVDIYPLISLPQLEELDISGNNISYLMPLDSLTRLTSLNVSGNSGINFNELNIVISNNPMLKRLGMNDVAINGPFPQFSSPYNVSYDFVELQLSNTGISDIYGIEQYAGLQQLDISQNGLSDISPLSSLVELQELDISGNSITDLAAITATTTGLVKLNVSGNSGLNFNQLSIVIEDNHYLTHLDLDWIAINGPLPLWTNPVTGQPYKLVELGLRNTGLTDISAIDQYTGLQKLDLAYNSVEFVSGLNALPLVELDLTGNNIVDIYTLNALTRLEKFFVDENNGYVIGYTEIEQLIRQNPGLTHLGLNGVAINGGMPPLQDGYGQLLDLVALDLGNTGLNNLSGIENYTGLKYLNLENNDFIQLWPLYNMTQLLLLDIRANSQFQCADVDQLVQSLVTTQVFTPLSCINGSVPTLDLLQPFDGATFQQIDAINLVASAFDNEDGDLNAAVHWFSDIDGYLGQGGNILTRLSAAAHTLTANVTDADNNTVAQSVQITVTANLAPQITGFWSEPPVVGNSISVFVFGNNFPTDGTASVMFNGVPQYTVSPVSSEMLIVRVQVDPSLFGPITVTTPDGMAVSNDVFGGTSASLQLTGIWPGTVQEGVATSVFLFGSGFPVDGSAEVYFNGVRQYMVAAVSSEMMIVRVTPDYSLSGQVRISVPGSGTVYSSDYLVVTP